MKKIIAILLTLVIACSFISCSSGEKWYCLGQKGTNYYTETYYVNIDFEDLDIGTYNIAYCCVQGTREMSSNDEIKAGILFVHEDRYDIVSSAPYGYSNSVAVNATIYK